MSGRDTSERASSGRRRSIGRRMSSNARLAIVGLIASALTISFVLWIQGMMRRQIDFAEPLARSTLVLEASVSRSFSELRAWVAYGDDDAKAERRRIWREQIAPEFDNVRQALRDGARGLAADEVDELRGLLQDIKYLQWSVEDFARSPANVVARTMYENEIQPMVVRLTTFFDTLSSGKKGADQALWRPRALVQELDSALVRLLSETTPAQVAEARVKVALARAFADEALTGTPSPDDRAVAREIRAVAARADEAIARQVSQPGTVSEHIYQRQLKPARQKAEALLGAISARQSDAVRIENRSVFRGSFLILALALLVAGLSLASLYVAYRLRDRVESALAKAKSVGQYVLEGRIGGGGMGQVFRARHALLRRPAAIKVLRAKQLMDPESQKRFRDEVRITSSLSHPNTVAVYDYGRTPEGFFYYAMELVDGVTLRDLVRLTGPLPPARVAHIVRQVCGSLREAHERGLLHRDIKPSNIMLAQTAAEFDVVKVLDFGLVIQARAQETSGSHVAGTPAYLAPELAAGQGRATERTEVYAVGAVAYFLVTGTELFDYDDVERTLAAQVSEPVVRPSERLGAPVAVDLEAVVVGCLDKQPDRRPASMNAVLDLLDDADIDSWARRDAEHWWSQYGEAVRTEAAASVAADSSSFDSQMHIGFAERSD